MEKISFFEVCRRLAVVTEIIIPDVFNDDHTRDSYFFNEEIRFLHYLDQIIGGSGWSKEDFLKEVANSTKKEL